MKSVICNIKLNTFYHILLDYLTEYTPPCELAGDTQFELGLTCSPSSATVRVSVSTMGSIASYSAISSASRPESTDGFVTIT